VEKNVFQVNSALSHFESTQHFLEQVSKLWVLTKISWWGRRRGLSTQSTPPWPATTPFYCKRVQVRQISSFTLCFCSQITSRLHLHLPLHLCVCNLLSHLHFLDLNYIILQCGSRSHGPPILNKLVFSSYSSLDNIITTNTLCLCLVNLMSDKTLYPFCFNFSLKII